VKLPGIVELARGTARFVKFEDQHLWYSVLWSGGLFEFPIPVTDAGGGQFWPEDKALTFMRWIRKHLEYLHGALAEDVYDQ
jgi:hypothetical protein